LGTNWAFRFMLDSGLVKLTVLVHNPVQPTTDWDA
jgi:hypothetical protein